MPARLTLPRLRTRPGPAERADRARRVPRPLALLLATVACFGLAWALLVPPWQAPDTPSHYAYVESLAARGALPGEKGRSTQSSDQTAADVAVGATRIAFAAPTDQPSWDPAVDRAYRRAAGHLSRSDGGGPNLTAINPPLYYLFAGAGYLAASGGDTFDRLGAIQISGVLLLLLTVTAVWLLVGEVLGPQRPAQLLAGALAGLEPMQTFISTSVNPDALLIPLWSLALWLGARVISRNAQRRDAVALCAVTAAAILTKATSYALLPGVVLAIFLGWRHRPVRDRRELLRTAGPALAVLAVPVLAWVIVTTALGRSAVNTVTAPPGTHPLPFSITQFVSYVWQFYLPRLPTMRPSPLTGELPLYHLWLRQAWGAFGWLDVGMPAWVYTVVTGVIAVILVAAAAVVARFRDRLRLELLGFFALVTVSLLAGLHLTEYRSILAHTGAVIQGRYILPLIGLLGLAVGLVVSRLPARRRALVCVPVLAGLMLLQLVALAAIATAYYA